MSGYLRRLVSNARNPSDGIRPIVGSIFTPVQAGPVEPLEAWDQSLSVSAPRVEANPSASQSIASLQQQGSPDNSETWGPEPTTPSRLQPHLEGVPEVGREESSPSVYMEVELRSHYSPVDPQQSDQMQVEVRRHNSALDQQTSGNASESATKSPAPQTSTPEPAKPGSVKPLVTQAYQPSPGAPAPAITREDGVGYLAFSIDPKNPIDYAEPGNGAPEREVSRLKHDTPSTFKPLVAKSAQASPELTALAGRIVGEVSQRGSTNAAPQPADDLATATTPRPAAETAVPVRKVSPLARRQIANSDHGTSEQHAPSGRIEVEVARLGSDAGPRSPAVEQPGEIPRSGFDPEVPGKSDYTPLIKEALREAASPQAALSQMISARRNEVNQGAARREAHATSEPDEIHIHIGRIEVTALPPPPVRPAAPPPRKSTSLHDYLNRRGRR